MKCQLRLYLVITLLIFSQSAIGITLQPGNLLISEVMANPSAVSDSNGEWFELFNASSRVIDLDGLIISDENSNFHEISSSEPLLIAPGEYFVLGRNNDFTTNGGFTADYIYTGISLSNTVDQIIISSADSEITRIDYSGLPFGSSGISAELISQVISPNSSHYQLTENFTYGAGDFGTPGSQGSFPLDYVNPVPLPGTVWLFISTPLLMKRFLTFQPRDLSSHHCLSHWR